MNYQIISESNHRIRIRLSVPRLTKEQAEILKYAFADLKGVTDVVIYRATAGCAFQYAGDRKKILERLNTFRFENVKMMAEEEVTRISMSEMKNRKLDPALKRRLRARILAETVFDIAMPMPLQIGYHVYQMITLKDI